MTRSLRWSEDSLPWCFLDCHSWKHNINFQKAFRLQLKCWDFHSQTSKFRLQVHCWNVHWQISIKQFQISKFSLLVLQIVHHSHISKKHIWNSGCRFPDHLEAILNFEILFTGCTNCTPLLDLQKAFSKFRLHLPDHQNTILKFSCLDFTNSTALPDLQNAFLNFSL